MDTSKNTLYWIIAILSIILFFTWCNNSQNDQRVSELEREIESLGDEQKKLDVKISNQKIEQDKINSSQQEAERRQNKAAGEARYQLEEMQRKQQLRDQLRRECLSMQRNFPKWNYDCSKY